MFGLFIRRLHGGWRQVVAWLPLSLKQRGKNLLLALVIHLGRRRAYALVRMMARRAGVPALLLQRADHVATEQHAPESAMRLLRFFMLLLAGKPPRNSMFDVSRFLHSDEERGLARDILKRARERLSGEPRHYVDMQLLRLRDAPADDLELAALCDDIVTQAITDCRGSTDAPIARALRENGVKTLLHVREVFAAKGWRFFLSSGTLLGLVRDGDIIPGDLDIDLGVFAEEIDPVELKAAMMENGYMLDRDFPTEVGFLSPSGVLVEFFFCQRTNNAVSMFSYGQVHEWRFTPFKLKEVPFLGTSFLAPNDPEMHLTENYGNWRDRVCWFDWAYDVPCARYANKREAMFFLATRFQNALRRRDRFDVERALTDLRRLQQLREA